MIDPRAMMIHFHYTTIAATTMMRSWCLEAFALLAVLQELCLTMMPRLPIARQPARTDQHRCHKVIHRQQIEQQIETKVSACYHRCIRWPPHPGGHEYHQRYGQRCEGTPMQKTSQFSLTVRHYAPTNVDRADMIYLFVLLQPWTDGSIETTKYYVTCCFSWFLNWYLTWN